MCDGKTAPEIEEFDLNTCFEELGLVEDLSPTGHVGVYASAPQIVCRQTKLDRWASDLRDRSAHRM